MSGTSRIGGHGGQFGGGGQRERSAALARFCRGRKQGDVVTGVFLRLETETLGWAMLEGEELLAHLPEEWSGGENPPSPGDRVFFRIEALAPEVVLRMLAPSHPLARLSAVMPSLPLAQEAALYIAARDRLDASLAGRARPGGSADPADPAGRKAWFIGQVAGDPGLLDLFAETSARSRSILRAARPAGLLFFRHMPWLSGAVSQIEVSLWRNAEAPVLAGARLAGGERLLVRGSMEKDVLRYRLGIVGAGRAAATARFAPVRTAASEYQGASSERTVDLVSHILALAADSGTMAVGRFSREV